MKVPGNGGVLAMTKTNVMLAMTKMFFKIKKIVNHVFANNKCGVVTLKIYLTFNGCDPTNNLYFSYFLFINKLPLFEYINSKINLAFLPEYFN